jgi:hypothetical protein
MTRCNDGKFHSVPVLYKVFLFYIVWFFIYLKLLSLFLMCVTGYASHVRMATCKAHGTAPDYELVHVLWALHAQRLLQCRPKRPNLARLC